MTTNSQRKHVVELASILLLSLKFIGLASGLLLQPSPSVSTNTPFVRRSIAFQHQQSKSCLCSASVAANIIDKSGFDATDDHPNQPAYDWDEQFEELQSFMSEYGHCNFPTQNPSLQLEQKYPRLKSFCHSQRIEHKRLIKSEWEKKAMTLFMFDRDIRCRRLGELGFEFSSLYAQWYDQYHELIQYQRENGHTHVTGSENKVLAQWVYDQRKKRRGERRISDSRIKLLDDIGFEWKSQIYEEQWSAKYKELVAFHNKHGHFLMEFNAPLYDFMKHQRKRRSGKSPYGALTEEQIALLDEIDFPWKAERRDLRWDSNYNELKRFQKKRGHCQPRRLKHTRLYEWSRNQRDKHRKGHLSGRQTKLLDEIGFTWETRHAQWPQMCRELAKYSSKNQGHLQVNRDDHPELYDWMAAQRNRYHDTVKKRMLTDQQIEQLEDLHFCWSLDWRDRTWHEKYTEAAEFAKEHGHVRVAEEDNPGLYNWIQMQEKRYKEAKGQKPLSEEELEMVEQIDFPFLEGQPRMAWNSMYDKLTGYREENNGRFPTSHKDDPDLNRWMRQQRHRYRAAYGYVPLSDEEKTRLESIDFPMYPTGKLGRQWCEKYDDLVKFWKQHGHFVVDKDEDTVLYNWIGGQRSRFSGSKLRYRPLSKMEIYLLERIDFAWVSDRNELQWQKTYEEVVEFLEARGHFPKISENRKLARWINSQRQIKKGKNLYGMLSEYQIQQLEKIGFRW